MNIYRVIGVMGVGVGIMVLGLMSISDAQAGAWLVQSLTDQFKNNLLMHVLGGVAAIASGGYLFTFGSND